MKLVYFVVDKLSEWLEGDPYRLAALVFVPVAAFLAIAIANEEMGYTIYSWGALRLKLNRKFIPSLHSVGRAQLIFSFTQSTTKVRLLGT